MAKRAKKIVKAKSVKRRVVSRQSHSIVSGMDNSTFTIVVGGAFLTLMLLYLLMA